MIVDHIWSRQPSLQVAFFFKMNVTMDIYGLLVKVHAEFHHIQLLKPSSGASSRRPSRHGLVSWAMPGEVLKCCAEDTLIPTTCIHWPFTGFEKPVLTCFTLSLSKRLHNHGKSPLLIGESTISMAIFNSYVSLPEGNFSPWNMMLQPLTCHWRNGAGSLSLAHWASRPRPKLLVLWTCIDFFP